MSNNDLCELSLMFLHETDAAWLVSETGFKEDAVWLPKSQCGIDNPDPESGEICEFSVPEWLALEKGLI